MNLLGYAEFYRLVHEQEEAEEALDRRPSTEAVLTPERLLVMLDGPRAPLAATADPIRLGYAADGTPRMRARPLAPRKGQPDLRVCAGCGGSMVGKRPQARFCEDCLPTVKNTANVRRLRSRETRTPDRLDADIFAYAKRISADLPSELRIDLVGVRRAFRDFGPYRVRAILDVLASDVDRVSLGDATHREHRSGRRVDHVVSGGDADGDLLVDHDPDAFGTTIEDPSEIAELMANRDRTRGRGAVRWPGLRGAGGMTPGESVRWNNGAIVRLPAHPLLDPRSLRN